VAVGRVARAHGVRGRVLITPYNAESQELTRLERLFVGGREYKLLRMERANLGYIAALEGLIDRDQADKLRGQEVEVPRDELPELPEGELYAIDLIGFELVDQHGKKHGPIEALEEAGPQDLLRLKGGVLVPLGLVQEVDDKARQVVVDAPDGLFELEE
jgi:16S rRNA processing protein RimM